MNIMRIENVKQVKMDLCPNLTKCNILVLDKLSESLTSVIRNNETFIEHQLRDSKRDWILALSPYNRTVGNYIYCHHSDIQFSKGIRISADLSFKKIWMITNFSELHD